MCNKHTKIICFIQFLRKLLNNSYLTFPPHCLFSPVKLKMYPLKNDQDQTKVSLKLMISILSHFIPTKNIYRILNVIELAQNSNVLKEK